MIESWIIDEVSKVVHEININFSGNFIKSHKVEELYGVDSTKRVGYSVELILCTTYFYNNTILDCWAQMFHSDEYSLKVWRNSLHVMYRVKQY